MEQQGPAFLVPVAVSLNSSMNFAPKTVNSAILITCQHATPRCESRSRHLIFACQG